MPAARVMLILFVTVVWPIPVGPSPLDGAAGRDAPSTGRAGPARLGGLVDVERRLERVEVDAHVVDDVVRREVVPLRGVLSRWTPDPALSTEIAVALVREGRRSGIDPLFLLAVMRVENAPLDPRARSAVGAVGLMQVMPFHAGAWGCEGDDLIDPAVNICHGARILANALDRSPDDVDRALLRYNGCVRGTNTRDCHLYPSRVRRMRAALHRQLMPAPGGERETAGRAI